MINYHLRKATQVDSDLTYQIKKSALKEYVEKVWGWTESFQQEYYAENFSPAHMMIIEVEQEAVGWMRTEIQEDAIYLSDLYLLPSYQNKGIGTQLIRQLQNESRAKGKPLRLEVLRVNLRAQAFYQRNGFQKTGKKPEKWIMEWQ